MNKTAIQQAIEIIEKKSRQQLPNAAVSSFLIAVGVLKNLLPVEKEQIEKAWFDGKATERFGDTSEGEENYYNKTFKG